VTEQPVPIAQTGNRVAEILGGAAAREIILAATGTKIARIAVTDGELNRVAPHLLALGLLAARSERKYVSRPDRGKGGFSNRFATRHPQRHPEARWLLYVASDREQAQAALDADGEGGDHDLGGLLRYPACCIAWYERVWRRAERHHQGDLFPLAHAATPVSTGSHRLLNFGANYFGGGWTSFFPCSLRCDAAIAQLTEERTLVRAVAPELAAQADELSLCPIVYTEFRGVAQLRKTAVDVRGETMHFEPTAVTLTLPAPRGSLWRSLLQGDSLRPTGRSGLEILRKGRTLHRERRSDAFIRWFADE
jgi:hypothetical protein